MTQEQFEALSAERKKLIETFLSAPIKVQWAIGKFLAAWSTLPPLVRAAAASDFAMVSVKQTRDCERTAESVQRLGLSRRAAVLQRFADSTDIVTSLMVELSKEGDEAAVKAGIEQLDVGEYEQPPVQDTCRRVGLTYVWQRGEDGKVEDVVVKTEQTPEQAGYVNTDDGWKHKDEL